MNVMLDHIFTEDREEDTLHQKNIRKTIEEPICTSDDLDFEPYMAQELFLIIYLCI